MEVPQSFRSMPRWWSDDAGRRWLDELPALVRAACAQWSLDPDGPARHGSNALVVPVRRGGEALALRLAPPGDDAAALAGALRTWDGRGVVRLVDEDPPARALLLERLDADRALSGRPVEERIEVLAGLTRVLAVPVGDGVPSTSDVAAGEADRFGSRAAALGDPVPRRLLDAASTAARVLAADPVADEAVDGDLHADQVLAGHRAPWLVVDPMLLRGDREHDLGRVLWTNLDDLRGDRAAHGAFDRFVAVAEVPAERARRWVLVRSTSYLLWGLERGLTEDPPRCRRLLELFA